MCGRYTSKKSAVDIAEEFHAVNRIGAEREPDFNVAPTRDVPVVRARTAADGDSRRHGVCRELVQMTWGLVPSWAKDPNVGGRMFNARVETVTTKPAYRNAVKRRRCIVPADGYYEWSTLAGGAKQPYYLTPQDGSSLAFAALWETWGADDGALTTCTIITTASAGQLQAVHDRMPFLLPPTAWARWLDPAVEDVSTLLERPDLTRTAGLELRPVGADVGRVANNRPDLIARIEPAAVLFQP